MSELGEIFREFGGQFAERSGHALSSVQLKALRDIAVCRTPAIERGGVYCCEDCGDIHFAWNSCGNRHCPKCGNDKISEWLEANRKKLLPVDYYMVTFTLPAGINKTACFNQKAVYDALFQSSSEALKELALDRRFLGGRIGMLGTLQTWRRDGGYHLHVHYIVPGGGISRDGKQWIYPKNRGFLVSSKPLASLFKGKFKAEMKDCGIYEKIPVSAWEKDWVVDCRNVGGGMSSFKYLAPYMQRVFISNNRIEKCENKNVTFRYTRSKTNETAYRTMPVMAFIAMFLMHVLPHGFMKTRYYGFLGSASANKLNAVRTMLLISRTQPPADESVCSFNHSKCRICGGQIVFQKTFDNRSGRGPPLDKIWARAS
ncbi:MAG: transposase [Dehalococcoidales bacterium]|nr:transposase [Dehalococcoidales bacterium]